MFQPPNSAPEATSTEHRPGRVQCPLLIHVGFHKTGSTWLQSSLFGQESCGFMLPDGIPRHQLVHDLVTADPLSFDADAIRGKYEEHIARSRQRGETLVLSHERLSGYPSSGGRDRGIIAERLARTFPEASILLVIRRQRDLIRSMYSQHITDGGVESIEHFLLTPEPQLCRRPSFAPELYEFDRLIAFYQRLFGRERLCVLPYELLVEDSDAFAAKVATFAGHGPAAQLGPSRRINPRRPLLMQQVQRPLNMLFYHNELSPGALLHISRFAKRYKLAEPFFRSISPPFLERWLERRISRAVDRIIGERYQDSNARTMALTGLDLRRFGYDLK
jgi:hypothetical protein